MLTPTLTTFAAPGGGWAGLGRPGAGPVGEALIMTAFGLAVAVPAVLGYNWLVRRNKVALENLRAFGADLHMVLMSGGAIQARSTPRNAASASR